MLFNLYRHKNGRLDWKNYKMSECKEAVRLPGIINMDIEANKLNNQKVPVPSYLKTQTRFWVDDEDSNYL